MSTLYRATVAASLISFGVWLLVHANEVEQGHNFSPRSANTISRAMSSRTLVRAQSCNCASVSFDRSTSVPFLMRQAANPDAFGMLLVGARGDGRAHQKGESVKAIHAFTFAPSRLVTQPVFTSSFPIGGIQMEPTQQLEFPLLTRMEGAAIVPSELMRTAKSYRQAVRLCWGLRRVKGMTYRQLAAECELIHQHVGDYFNADDKPGRRELPAEAVLAVEATLGNHAISQWHARRAGLTVLEELQASRRA